MVLDMQARRVSLDGHDLAVMDLGAAGTRRQHTLHCARATTIRPRCATVIPFSTPTAASTDLYLGVGTRSPSSGFLACTVPLSKSGSPGPRFLIPECLVDVDDGSQGAVWGVNPSEEEVNVPVGAVLGVAEDVDGLQVLTRPTRVSSACSSSTRPCYPSSPSSPLSTGPTPPSDSLSSTTLGTPFPPAHTDSIPIPENVREPYRTSLRQLLREYSDVFSVDKTDVGQVSLLTHDIDTGDALPCTSKQQPLSEFEKGILRQHVKDWKEKGLVNTCNSPWSSPVVVVRKSGPGTEDPYDYRNWRICMSYIKLNKLTRNASKYPTIRICDAIEELKGGKVFSSLDVTQAFHSVKLSEASA